MALLQPGAEGGFLRRLYWPENPAGLWAGLGSAAALFTLHAALQAIFAFAILYWGFGGDASNEHNIVVSGLIGLFPASLIVAAAAWWLAGRRGGDPLSVLSLRPPPLTAAGWLVLIPCFMIFMYLAIMLIVMILGIDLAQYTPGPNGESPETGSAGLVKEAMFSLAKQPWLFAAVFPSVAFGAPIAEELVFRGQLFSVLSRTRLGVSGTTVLTSAIWAALHYSEPLLSMALIFVMGLVFGWMLYRFGSLWVTMACHSAWNSFYAIIILLTIGASS